MECISFIWVNDHYQAQKISEDELKFKDYLLSA